MTRGALESKFLHEGYDMNHQTTLDALTAARYWLEAHPDLPTPDVNVNQYRDSTAGVRLSWHMTAGMGTHEDALVVLRAFADWPWQASKLDGGITSYRLERDGFTLIVFADTAPTVTEPVNLLDALAEVSA